MLWLAPVVFSVLSTTISAVVLAPAPAVVVLSEFAVGAVSDVVILSLLLVGLEG